MKNGKPIFLGLLIVLAISATRRIPSEAAFGLDVPTPEPGGSRSEILTSESSHLHPLDFPKDAILPDLQNLPPSDVELIYSYQHKYLRFSISILNGGSGILKLVGQPSVGDEDVAVHQVLFNAQDQKAGEFPVGVFAYHPFHFHMHLGDFALYEIWSLRQDFTLDRVVASGGKISYCVRDVEQIHSDEEGRPGSNRPAFTTCTAVTQGLSPGWADIYANYLPGQAIEISHLPNGAYALTSTVNPNKNLYEADLSNNMGTAYFYLNDYTLTMLPGRIADGLIRE